MASLVHQTPTVPAATEFPTLCDDGEFGSQGGGVGCFGRSVLSRTASSGGMEYRPINVADGAEAKCASQERSARAKLRWRAVAHELMRSNGGARRPRKPAFSYDSKSYALNFDDGAGCS